MNPLARFSLASAATLLVCGQAALAQTADNQCNAAMLRGLYAFNASGFNVLAGNVLPKSIVEFIRFNGDGTLSVPAATRSLNGVIVRIPPFGLGTYTVAPDCTGSLVFGPPGPTFDLFIGPSGLKIRMIQVTDPTPGALPVLQGIVEKIGR
jgi:hypothetical protein